MKYHIGFFIFPLLTACVVLIPYHYCSCLPYASRSVYVFFSWNIVRASVDSHGHSVTILSCRGDMVETRRRSRCSVRSNHGDLLDYANTCVQLLLRSVFILYIRVGVN
jgi:hypothetical protein